MGGEEQALTATEEACRVYVGNLLPKAKESHLTSKFARFGTIHSVWIARRPPGFAFVRFAAPDAAQRAVEASREDGAMEILGKAVRVQMAGGKDGKHSIETEEQQQLQSKSKDRATAKGSDAVESGDHDQWRRSRSARRDGRAEDSRGSSYGRRSRCRSSSGGGERHRWSERQQRNRRSRNSCRGSYRLSRFAHRSRSRSELRRTRSTSRSRSRRRDAGRSSSRSRSRSRGHEATRRRRRRSSRSSSRSQR